MGIQKKKSTRRKFIDQSLKASLAYGLFGSLACSSPEAKPPVLLEKPKPWFDISLAQWSLHRKLQSGKLTNLEFASYTREKFDIDAIEYVNAFFTGGADEKYLKQVNQKAKDVDVKQLLIMVDGEGDLGDLNNTKRIEAVKNHHKWVEAAKYLGCHSIRVNAFGMGSAKDVQSAATESLGELSQFAEKMNINIIVENHGSYSSDGKWLTKIMNQVNMKNCGTLPDFGNFCIEREGGKRWDGKCINEYDRYQGTREMMAYAKGGKRQIT